MEQNVESALVSSTQEMTSVEPRVQYFQGDVRAVRLSFAYKIALGAVLVAMIALPLIYLGLIAFAAWGVYLYAVAGLKLFRVIHSSYIVLLLYVGPIVAGVILVCFMIKPIFSGFRFRQFGAPISHTDHPEFFRFLGQLCQLLGAPIPSRVDVQLGVNASAGFRAGFASLFGNDIMLRIGLPLVAGLNCREFAAVLSHELGHFRQRTAMRLRYVISSINGWFGRAVFERDELDDWIEEATNASGFTLFAFLLARIGIALTRGILWIFMICSHALNSFMCRQMEFDADACSLSVAGTEAVLRLHHKLRVLDFSEAEVFARLKGRVQPKMPDDLSAYIALMASQYSGELQGKVFRAANSYKSKWYDSHPSDAARNARAAQANLPGLIQDTRPATCLFGDFAVLSRKLTDLLYMSLGSRIRRAQIFHVEAQVEDAPETAEEEEAIKSFFGGLGPVMKPLLFGPEARLTIGSVSEKMDQMRQAKSILENVNLLEIRESIKSTDVAFLQALQQQALLDAGLLNSEVDALVQPAAVLEQLTIEWNTLCEKVDPLEKAAQARIIVLLSFLRAPAIAGVLDQAERLHDEVTELLHFSRGLSAAFPPLLTLRKHFAKAQALLPYRTQGCSELVDAALHMQAGEMAMLLDEIHKALGRLAYPFSHVRANLSVIEYAKAKEYDPDRVRMTCKEAESHLQMLFALYFKSLGRLIAVASVVERVLDQIEQPAALTIDRRTPPVVRIVRRTPS